MIKKLQLVVLGVVVLQGASLDAMENKATNSPRRALSCSAEGRKDPVEINKTEKGIKRQYTHRSMPHYLEGTNFDWPTELKKNPRLAWLPI